MQIIQWPGTNHTMDWYKSCHGLVQVIQCLATVLRVIDRWLVASGGGRLSLSLSLSPPPLSLSLPPSPSLPRSLPPSLPPSLSMWCLMVCDTRRKLSRPARDLSVRSVADVHSPRSRNESQSKSEPPWQRRRRGDARARATRQLSRARDGGDGDARRRRARSTRWEGLEARPDADGDFKNSEHKNSK